MKDKKDLLVVGFPRTAERFLSHNYGSITKTRASISHEVIDLYKRDAFLVTVIRDPKDAISSAIALSLWQRKQGICEISRDSILEITNRYYMFYTLALMVKSITFINFEDVTGKTMLVVDSLASMMGDTTINKKITSQKEIEELSHKSSKYISTSKNLELYNEVRMLLSDEDLDLCYKVYSRCLDRCIIIPNDN